MLIGIDANEANLTQNRVGINQYAFSLIHALHDIKTDHNFIIYLKNAPLEDLPKESGNLQYRVIPFPKFWTQTRLPFDLYNHSPRPDVFFSATHYAPRFTPIPSVISIMDLGFLDTPEQFASKDYNQLKNWTAYSVKNASKIIAISEYTKRDVIRIYGKDEKDVAVTQLAYNKNLFKPITNQTTINKVLAKYKIERPFFFFLGSLRPSKNIEGLIKSFGHSHSLAKHMLVIGGRKGWLYEQIFELVKELKLEKRIIFTGFLPDPDLPTLMSASDAFVMPSFIEGFGIPILEAMACGTPVVISNIASLPEVGGDAAIYVDPRDPNSIADGLSRAVKERGKFVKLGLERVKLFDWAKTAQETLMVLESAKRGIIKNEHV